MELNPRDPAHWPFIGSVVDYVERPATPPTAAERPGRAAQPRAPLGLQQPARVGEVARAGPYGGFLGQAYDPICTEFVGQATQDGHEDPAPTRPGTTSSRTAAITPESRFQLGVGLAASAPS